MKHYYIFFAVFFLISIAHIYYQSVLIRSFIGIYFYGLDYNFNKTQREKSDSRIYMLLNAVFFLSPLFIFKWILKTNYENFYLNCFLLLMGVIFAIGGLYYNLKLINKEENSSNLNYDSSPFKKKQYIKIHPRKTPLNLKISTKKRKGKKASVYKFISESEKVKFKSFLKEVCDTSIYNKESEEFDVSNLKLLDKYINQYQCRYLLIIYFFEEILVSNKYLNNLSGYYIYAINEQLGGKLTRANFNKFKNKQLSEMGIFEIKENEFYIELSFLLKKSNLK